MIHGPGHDEGVEQRNLLHDRWLWIGAGLLVAFLVIAVQIWRTVDFEHGAPGVLIAATLLHVGAGVAFLFVLLRGRRYRHVTSPLLLGMVVLGVLMRLAAAPAAPGWEDDFYRYLWDGAVVSEGINPYAHPPEAARTEDVRELIALAAEAGIVHERINHPHLRTIYPPLAQTSFFAAHQISPWSIDAWRFIVLVHDIAAFALVLLILRSLGLPLIWSAIHWINPLLVKEFYQSMHMDALLLPWLLGAILLAVRCRPIVSMGLLACAAAVKFWPAMLVPILLRRLTHRPAIVAIAAIAFALVASALLAPMLLHEAAPDSGLTRYAEAWQNNAGFYALHHSFWHHALPLIGVEAWHSQQVARWATGALLFGVIGLLCLRPITSDHDLVRRCVVAAIALFLLSPTQFPWYFSWLVPLLALWPVRALLLYVALLPLYHLNEIAPWVVWGQHVPVWGLLMYDGVQWFRSNARITPDQSATTAATRPSLEPARQHS